MPTPDAEAVRRDLRATAEALLCAATGATRITRLCPACGSSEHGRPRLLGHALEVSISYAGDLVAVAWGAGPIGIDIEQTAPARARPARASLADWTRIEALAKAAGTGLRDWPDLELPDLPTRRLRLPEAYVGTLAGDGEVSLGGPAVASC